MHGCVKRRERVHLISMETHAHDIELMFNLLKSQAEIGWMITWARLSMYNQMYY